MIDFAEAETAPLYFFAIEIRGFADEMNGVSTNGSATAVEDTIDAAFLDRSVRKGEVANCH